MRSFVGIPLPPEIRREIASAVGKYRHLADGVRWVAEENLHVTLKFLGDLPDAGVARMETDLAAVASTDRPFSLEIGATTAFPDPRRPRVVVIACEGDVAALKRLAAEIETRARVVGVAAERREYRAHITIGRVKDGRKAGGLPRFLVALKDARWGSVTVEAFNLYESFLQREGSVYRVIRSFPLGHILMN